MTANPNPTLKNDELNLWIAPTTSTTPPAAVGACLHEQFESKTKIHRQIHPTGYVTWNMEVWIWCAQCGVEFLFPVGNMSKSAMTGIVPPPGHEIAGQTGPPPNPCPVHGPGPCPTPQMECPVHGKDCPNKPKQ